MITHFELDKFVKVLEEKFGTKANYNEIFNIYSFSGITEEQLKDEGFEFYGYDYLHNYPMYRKENLEGYFNQQIFYLYQFIK